MARRLIVPTALLAAVLAGSGLAAALGPVTEAPLATIGALVGAGAAWLVAVALAPRWPDGRVALWIVLGGALALRLVALAAEPGTSDDVHRYVWEGALVAEGTSPYAFAPAAPELAAVRAERPQLYARVGHPEVSAAYPPLSQAVFAFAVVASGGADEAEGPAPVGYLRLLFATCDLLVCVPLLALLRRRGRPVFCLVAWAWCPLVAFELGGAAHLDALALPLLVGGLALAEAGRARGAAAALAGGVLAKLLPIVALPFALRGRRDARGALVVFVATTALGVAWVGRLEGGFGGLTAGLAEYGFRWESASLVHRFLEAGFDLFLERDEGPADPRRLARYVGAALVAVAALVAWRRRLAPATATFVVLGAWLVFTPTLHPWYVVWIVPFLALQRARAFAWLAAVAPLLFAPVARWRSEGVWEEPAWLLPVVALPFFALLALDLSRRR